jgi:hypothetical protein
MRPTVAIYPLLSIGNAEINASLHLDARLTIGMPKQIVFLGFLPDRNIVFGQLETQEPSSGANPPVRGSVNFRSWERRNRRPSCKIAGRTGRVNTFFGKAADLEVPKKGYFFTVPIRNPRGGTSFSNPSRDTAIPLGMMNLQAHARLFDTLASKSRPKSISLNTLGVF